MTILMEYGTARRYRVFTRTWWRENPSYPDGLEAEVGHKTCIGKRMTEDEARAFAHKWNLTHEPGRLSLRAEYEEE